MSYSETTGNAKITFEEACGIRRRVLVEKSSDVKREAEAYGVGRETIRRILRGETFAKAAASLREVEKKITPGEIERSQERLKKMLQEEDQGLPLTQEQQALRDRMVGYGVEEDAAYQIVRKAPANPMEEE